MRVRGGVKNGCVLHTAAEQRERDVSFWKANKSSCFVLLLLYGCGCLPGTHLVKRLDADSFTDPVTFACCLLLASGSHLGNLGRGIKAIRALRLSLALHTPSSPVRPNGTLYLQLYSNEMGRRASPRMSQQNGNQRVLIKATNLQTGTCERPHRLSCFSLSLSLLTTKKDLERLSCTPCWVLSL